MTKTIQLAIDKCEAKGGGMVVFSEGIYRTGSIELKSKVGLYLTEGSIIEGSEAYTDYGVDALIYANKQNSISITGRGIIDGVDCLNPNGEEGFRGPHALRFKDCQNLSLKDFTVRNAANYAINCRNCSYGSIASVNIRAGHDGLHTRFCTNFTVKNCDFRVGDDAFAGNDNRDFYISNCSINTSCNGFRIGCLNLRVEKCKLWGPGEYMHKIQKRNNMLSAFVHFSPKDEDPELVSGNWIIRDIIVENVDHFYMYNFEDGLWQTGKPFSNVSFEAIKASEILSAFNVIGDSLRQFELNVINSSFSFREGAEYYEASLFEGAGIQSSAFISLCTFNKVKLSNVKFKKEGEKIILRCKSGNSLFLENVRFINKEAGIPYLLEGIDEVKLTKI